MLNNSKILLMYLVFHVLPIPFLKFKRFLIHECSHLYSANKIILNIMLKSNNSGRKISFHFRESKNAYLNTTEDSDNLYIYAVNSTFIWETLKLGNGGTRLLLHFFFYNLLQKYCTCLSHNHIAIFHRIQEEWRLWYGINHSVIIAKFITKWTVALFVRKLGHVILKAGSFVVIVVFWDLDAKLQHFLE